MGPKLFIWAGVVSLSGVSSQGQNMQRLYRECGPGALPPCGLWVFVGVGSSGPPDCLPPTPRVARGCGARVTK